MLTQFVALLGQRMYVSQVHLGHAGRRRLYLPHGVQAGILVLLGVFTCFVSITWMVRAGWAWQLVVVSVVPYIALWDLCTATRSTPVSSVTPSRAILAPVERKAGEAPT